MIPGRDWNDYRSANDLVFDDYDRELRGQSDEDPWGFDDSPLWKGSADAEVDW